jgi:hypothetical protein
MAVTTDQAITEQITRTKLEGADEAIGKAKKLDQVYDDVVETSEKLEQQFLSAEKALLKFNRQFEPGFREAEKLARAQKDLTKAVEQGLIAPEEMARKLRLVSGANDNVTRTTGLARHQIQNLTAQFVDLGVQLSAGGGILLPLIQQGPQAIQAVGGLSRAIELVTEKWRGLSVLTKGAIVGGGIAAVGAISAKIALDLSKGFANITQPERVEQSLERITNAFRELANQADLFFNRAPSNVFIDEVNKAAADVMHLANAIKQTRLEREALNASVLAQPLPPTGPAGWATGPQGFLQPASALGPAALGLPEIGLPAPLRSELMAPIELEGGGGREGRKELIDGVDSAFDKNLTKHGLKEHPQQFGDAFARVWSPTVEKSDSIARQADTANRQGLDDIEKAIYGLEGTLQSVGTTIVRNAAGVTVGESADQERIDEFTRLARETPGLGATGPITTALRVPRIPAFSELGKGFLPVERPSDAGFFNRAGIPPTTATDMSALDPIADLIARLRDQQDAVMQRSFTPDPYSDKNPDVFYSGGRLFKEQQDKIWQGLQDQINQLATLQTTAEQHLRLAQNLPADLADALVSALTRAGMTATDIARLLTGTQPTSAGTPTAQPGYLANLQGSTPFRSGTFGRRLIG